MAVCPETHGPGYGTAVRNRVRPRVYDGLAHRIPAHVPERRGREPVAGRGVVVRAGRRGDRGGANRRMGERPVRAQAGTGLFDDRDPDSTIRLSREPGLGAVSGPGGAGLCRARDRSRCHGDGTGKLPRKPGIRQRDLYGRGFRVAGAGDAAAGYDGRRLWPSAGIRSQRGSDVRRRRTGIENT